MGGGDVNVHVNLHHDGWTPRPKVWWRSQVKPWRIVWQCEWKKIRASFQAQIPCKLQVIVKNTSKSRGFLRPFWGMNQQFRYGEKDIFFKTLKTLARIARQEPNGLLARSPAAGVWCAPSTLPLKVSMSEAMTAQEAFWYNSCLAKTKQLPSSARITGWSSEINICLRKNTRSGRGLKSWPGTGVGSLTKAMRSLFSSWVCEKMKCTGKN